ncbi:HAD-IB family hydrolase, partial [Streptomyces sp. NPDC059398]|uniref:HAD-IB family hydrolase n=1 Tax=Streptomyces sp. NPDC059398 TaxID=3346820 RepID=UPI0036C38FA0
MLGAVENHSSPRTAAFFDLDKTVIAKSSTLTFSKSFYQGGLINRRAVLRTAYAQFVFLAGGADHDQMERMREYLSALCKGWNVRQVKQIVAETLHDLIDPIIYDEAASLIEEHHTAGRDVVIVSTSGAEVVEPIGDLLGADRGGAPPAGVGAAGGVTRAGGVRAPRAPQPAGG